MSRDIKEMTAITRNIANGEFTNLSVQDMGNSKVLVIPPKTLKDLRLFVGSRVMVIPYE